MRTKFHTERAALFRHCRYHFFHLKELKPCKFHEIWCETPFQQITPTLILVSAQTVMVDCDQRQRKQVRKHNSGYPLALHQNKLTANKVGNSKTLENSNFIWNRHILFLFVGQKRDSELPSCVRFLLAPFTEFPLISPTCRRQTIMIPETGLRRPQQMLQSCTLQLPFIVLFPEIERVPSQLNLLHFHWVTVQRQLHIRAVCEHGNSVSCLNSSFQK